MFNKEYINEICQRYVGRKPVSIYPYFVTLGSLENTVVKKSQFFGAASRSPGESPLDNLKRLYFLEVYCIGKNDFNIQAWSSHICSISLGNKCLGLGGIYVAALPFLKKKKNNITHATSIIFVLLLFL